MEKGLDDVNNHPFKPKHGVPQGKITSPLLFIFYLVDMLNNTTGLKFNYTDDSQILVTTENQATTCLIVDKK